MLVFLYFTTALTQALLFSMLIRPGELLSKYARFINMTSGYNEVIKKLLLCPYCLFSWLLTIGYLDLYRIGQLTSKELLYSICAIVPLFTVVSCVAVTNLRRFLNKE